MTSTNSSEFKISVRQRLVSKHTNGTVITADVNVAWGRGKTITWDTANPPTPGDLGFGPASFEVWRKLDHMATRIAEQINL
jgi:hypothetical protein